jgi:glutamate racemase
MDSREKKEEAIGIFDSGVGGISVLKELQKEMPYENFIFYGDQKNAPYGEKSGEEVRALSLKAYLFLQKMKVKATVIACNTATSAAARFLREHYPDDIIIGMEPAVKPAAFFQEKNISKNYKCEKETGKKRILVMATESTLKGDKLHHLIDSLKEQGEYILLPAPGIVRLLEEGKGHGDEMLSYLRELLSPYREERISSIVLGCTHFPFVKKEILDALGYPVPFFDGAAGTARETRHRLEERGLLRDKNYEEADRGIPSPSVELYSSTGDSSLLETFYRLPI